MRDQSFSSEKYIVSLLKTESASQLQSRSSADELGLGRISLSPVEGRVLALLVRLHGCRKFVEIGTLTGLSAQYILEGMNGEGTLWSLEKTETHAEKAQAALAQHPFGKQAHLVVGDARVTLEDLKKDGPFDGVFIDGNKAAYGDYLAWAERNLRKGGLIIADNVFLSGSVWGESEGQGARFNEKQVRVMQEFNKRLADTSLYDSALLPTSEGLFAAIKKF